MHMSVCACLCVNEGQCSRSATFFNHFPSYFGGQHLSLNLKLTNSAGMAGQPVPVISLVPVSLALRL